MSGAEFDAPHLGPRPANEAVLTPLSFLQRALELHGHRPAVAWGEARWSYAEFGALVARMAHWLAAQGVGRGDVVSVMLGNRPEMLAAHYAVPALGAVLNAVNTRLEAGEVAYILAHAGARLMLCEPATAELAGRAAAEADVPLHRLCATPGDEGLDFFAGPVPALDLTGTVTDERQAIALNYTSGTPGRPKGVVYRHRGAFLNAMGNVLALGLTEASRYLWTLPMFHCNGWCHTWAVTAAGGLHVCLDRVEPGPILDRIGAHGVTHMSCAPVVLYMLLAHGGAAPAARVRVATGGAAPTPALLAGLERMGFELIHLYGLTESYGPATLNDPGAEAPAELEDRARLLARQGQRHVTAGAAVVLGPDGAEVPADGATMGEIALAGNTVMAGYFRDPEATETAFRGGRFHTGDLAVRHPDGQIEIRDRAKDIIISGGENVSSLEVETVLHQHPGVLLAAVVAAPDPKWGETPWAFVEPQAGQEPDAAALDAFCRARLAGFKRPRRFVFGPLPRTATGKIQKFLLRERARQMQEP
jgi:fatty-acyl-CoA synthase